MASARRRRMRRLAKAVALGGLAAGALELQRRRDLDAIQGDPEWWELNRSLDGRSVDVRSFDGTRLHAEIFGAEDAPTILLVHGWTCDITFWHYQIRDLSRYFRVVTYDQRGHGHSDVPEDEDCYTAATLAGDMQAVLDACVPADQRCVVAGHSMGGMTLVAWAGSHAHEVRDRIAGAVLANTGMNELTARLLVLGPVAGKRLHELTVWPVSVLNRPFSTRLEPISFRVIRRIAAMPDTSAGRVAFLHRMILNCPAPVRSGFGRLFNGLDLSESVRDLDVPAIVIGSEGDRLTPTWHAEQLAANLPQVVEFTVLRGIGHMAPVEAPDEVTRRIRQLAADTLAPARSPVLAS